MLDFGVRQAKKDDKASAICDHLGIERNGKKSRNGDGRCRGGGMR